MHSRGSGCTLILCTFGPPRRQARIVLPSEGIGQNWDLNAERQMKAGLARKQLSASGAHPRFEVLCPVARPSMKIAFSLLLACILFAIPLAGMGAPAPAQAANSQPPQGSAAAASDSSLNDLLARLRATAEKMDADVQRLRVDKWKADSDNKKQSQ